MQDDDHRRERAEYFCRCVERLAQRVGLRDAMIHVARHMSDVATVDVKVRGTARRPRRRRRTPGRRRTYSPEQVRRMFQLLLKLLLKTCNVSYGKFQMQLAGGKLTEVAVTESFRPGKEDEMEGFGAKFT